MTESQRAIAERGGGPSSWTCSRCEMTVSFDSEVAKPRLPSTWSREAGELYCLGCRRELAGEAGVEDLEDDATNEERRKTRVQARIEFEIGRDPDREDNRIAKACGTSIAAVRKARARLGDEPHEAIPRRAV
jgi:hypothetical protein